MPKIRYFTLFLSLSCCFLNANSFAYNALKDVEISVAGGFNKGYVNNTYLVITPTETDSVLVHNVSKNAVWKLGIGKHFFTHIFKKREYINDLFVELNYYRSAFTIKGNVWQYELPEFNNFSFNAPNTSNRLMIDLKPALMTWRSFSPYPIIGLGVAWNNIAFHESLIVNDVDPASVLSLSRKVNTNFAYDLGAGMRVNISKNITASVEYLYTNLGNNIAPSAQAEPMVTLQAPPKFKIYTQSVMVGLNWKIN